MASPYHFKAADFDDGIDALENGTGTGLFKAAEIVWTKPRIWRPTEPAPIKDAEQSLGHIYAIVRDHHLAKRRENIAYIGISTKLRVRFYNHPKAHELVQRRGITSLSIGNVRFTNYTKTKTKQRAIGELEHLLIWAIGPEFNERKQYSLPGFGSRRGMAWHITNKGHRFAGQMPREIAYPWMLVKPGRNRSLKTR
jgi:hypothetical protein